MASVTKTGGSVSFQPLSSELTAISNITPADDDFIQRKSGVWVKRTVTQVKSDLSVRGIFSSGNISGGTLSASSTYYVGGSNLAPSATESFYRIYVPVSITIKSVVFATLKGTASSAHDCTVSLRTNATTDNILSTNYRMTTTNGYDAFTASGLSIALAASEFFAFKITTGAFSTSPTSTYFSWTIEYVNLN